MFPCPRCKKDTISLKNKYLAGLWQPIRCPECNTRLTAFPWLLMFLHMIYVWNVMWFAGLYYFDHNPISFLYMLLGWVVLDVLNLQLIPLAAMKNST